ncbi:hypothetical protein MTO96_022209 [Rhipicephalus appendiculatus]
MSKASAALASFRGTAQRDPWDREIGRAGCPTRAGVITRFVRMQLPRRSCCICKRFLAVGQVPEAVDDKHAVDVTLSRANEQQKAEIAQGQALCNSAAWSGTDEPSQLDQSDRKQNSATYSPSIA